MEGIISAETARKLSMENLYKDEIEKINEKIDRAIYEGQTSCEYYDKLSSLVEETFTDLGYTIITRISSWTDSGHITFIYW